MNTITLLGIRLRGWLGWKLVDAGHQGLAHRIAPTEIAAPAEVVR